MPSNNSKYTQEFWEETARHVIESGKSATCVAKEIGIDKNTVCGWVKAYREKNGLPSYEEENGRLRKELSDEQEKVEILKKSLHIFMQARE